MPLIGQFGKTVLADGPLNGINVQGGQPTLAQNQYTPASTDNVRLFSISWALLPNSANVTQYQSDTVLIDGKTNTNLQNQVFTMQTESAAAHNEDCSLAGFGGVPGLTQQSTSALWLPNGTGGVTAVPNWGAIFFELI